VFLEENGGQFKVAVFSKKGVRVKLEKKGEVSWKVIGEKISQHGGRI